VAAFTLLIFFENFAGSTGAAKAGGAVLAVAWLFQLVARPRETPFLLREHPVPAVAAITLVALGFSSMLWADDSARASEAAIRLLQVVLLYFIVFSAVRGPRELRLLTWAFVLGAASAGFVGLATGEGFAETDRLSGGIQDPNFLAASQVAAAAVAAFLAFSPSLAPGLRLVALAAAGICLLALFQTQSRGGVIALATMLVVSIAIAGRARVRAVVMTLIVAGFAVTYFAVFATLEARERVTSDYTEGGGAGRYDSWSIAWNIAGDHPVLGVGLANFPTEQLEYTAQSIPIELVGQILETTTVVHNSYLETLAELGPLGLAALLVAVAAPLALALRALRRERSPSEETEMLIRGFATALTALLVAYFFLSGEYEKQLWLLAALTAAAAAVSRPGRATPEAVLPGQP
jgi:O-antigen ligase